MIVNPEVLQKLKTAKQPTEFNLDEKEKTVVQKG